MSTQKPTAPKDSTTALSPTEYWRDVQSHTGSKPDAESAPSQVAPAAVNEGKRGHVLSRRARFAVAGVIVVFAAALGWIAASALLGGDSAFQTPTSPAKARQPGTRRTSRTRWVREPGEPNQSDPSSRRHAVPDGPPERHRARPRHSSSTPATPEPRHPSKPPAVAATPEPAPEPGEPAPPTAS